MSGELRERRLFDDLPGVYRRHGGRVLERYLDLAGSLVDPLRADVVELVAARAPELLARFGIESLAAAGVGSVATARELVLRLARSGSEPALPPPVVWPGRVLEETDAGELVVRPSAGSRAVVLAWSRADVPTTPGSLDLDEDDLPGGVAVQAALVDSRPFNGVPVPGTSLCGVVFWSRRTAVRIGPAVTTDP